MTGKNNVSVIGKAEFLADATFKSNLNLEGAIIREYQEALNNNLKIGDAVYISGSNIVAKAYSDITDDNGNFRPAIGIVVEIQTDFPPASRAGSQGQEETSSKEGLNIKEGLNRTVKVAVGGTVNGFKNLVPGAVYYLNNTDSINNINISDSATSTQDNLIEMISLTNAPAKKINNYIQSIAIAESENSLLILPSLIYEEYTEDIELPSVNYNPIYIDNVTVEQAQPAVDTQQTTENTGEELEIEKKEIEKKEIKENTESASDEVITEDQISEETAVKVISEPETSEPETSEPEIIVKESPTEEPEPAQE